MDIGNVPAPSVYLQRYHVSCRAFSGGQGFHCVPDIADVYKRWAVSLFGYNGIKISYSLGTPQTGSRLIRGAKPGQFVRNCIDFETKVLRYPKKAQPVLYIDLYIACIQTICID